MPVTKYTRTYRYSGGLNDVDGASANRPISGVLPAFGLQLRHQPPTYRSARSASVPPMGLSTGDVTNIVSSLRSANAGRFLPQATTGVTGRLSKVVTHSLHDNDDDYVINDNKARRMRSMLEQLRRESRDVDGPAEVLMTSPAPVGSVRMELNNFARALRGLDTLPVTTSSSGHVIHSTRDGLPERIQMTRGDLQKLEALVNQTFGGVRQVEQQQQLRPLDGSSVNTEQIFIDESRRPGDVDYTTSDSLASLAVRWAEERRRAVEREIELRRYSDANFYTSPADIVSRSKRVTHYTSPSVTSNVYGRRPDDYVLLQSALDPRPRPVPMTTRTLRSRQYADLDVDDLDLEPVVSGDWKSAALEYQYLPQQPKYTRSFSATTVRPITSSVVTSSYGGVGSGQETGNYVRGRSASTQPSMSETRRKVRQLLCKSKGDPHYFDNRNRDFDD